MRTARAAARTGTGSGLAGAIRRGLAWADAWMNRLYGWRGNPLYQSGTIAVLLLLLILVTGIYLLLFYRLGDPHGSVARVTEQVWLGRWVRGVHRFASDLAILAVLVHALRMFVQGRNWGPRALAWLSGLALLFLVLVCGWTGYVMVWDTQGQLIAQEGARLLDLLPIFSEPIGRAFVTEAALPSAFFFLNLFLHVALPIGLGLVLWLHVSRVARPVLLPPRPLAWAVVVGLVLVSLVWPLEMAPRADLHRLPDRVPVDYFYAFWIPAARGVAPALTWGAGFAVTLLLVLTPWLARPSAAHRPQPSVVDERMCTGCEQCYLDCPFEAIAMQPRADGRDGLVAHVSPNLCVSCGICAGSCAPMGVGPPGRTGRDQLEQAHAFLAAHSDWRDQVVMIACTRSAGATAPAAAREGALLYPVTCAGNLHTSVIELLIRSGVSGVLLGVCPPRDCRNREGPHWLEERVYHDREAELRERVDRRRVRLLHAGSGEPERLHAALSDFRRDLSLLDHPAPEAALTVGGECTPPVGAGDLA